MNIYKKIVLIFSLFKAVSFLTFFCARIYNMVDSEYSMDIFKSVKIIIGTVITNPEILKFVSDHLKSNKISELSVISSNKICS